MTNEEQFVAAIDLIADKLGIAVTEVFEIFVNAQATIGVMIILECIIVLLLCVATYFISMKLLGGCYSYHASLARMEIKNGSVDEDDKSFMLSVPAFIGFVSVLVWTIIVDTIAGGMLKIMCPEYSAILEIINVIT